ncbi:hypothetical protein M569_07502, partial [Genlisea aurea]
NYFTWRRGVRLALGAKNKLGIIDGDVPQPPINDPSYGLWLRNDCMVTSWLLNSISKELVSSFTNCGSAIELWRTLAAHYGIMNNNLLYQNQYDLYNLKQGDLSISEYYTKLTALWKDMDTLFPEVTCDHC